MKKMMFILTALICMAMTAQAQTVYVSTGSDAVAYHKNKSCSYLKNSKDVKSVSTAEAKKMGRHECQRCYGTATATKKTTTATKKTTTATKKTTPARDEKGRFVKKADTEKKATTTKKSTPARDEKGRFIKTTDQKTTKKAAEKKATTTKKTTEKKVKKAA
jgi:DNA-binding protein HU-beta